MPTNVNLSKKPENVQNSMTPTENTNWAEMPPKYESNNVSTNIKFRENQIGSMNKRKRLEEICEEKPSRKKFGIGGGVLVRESNFEGGGGGNVKNVMKTFGKFLERPCLVVLL